MAGGAVGMIVHRVAPFPTGDVGAYALVGMGTLFAGIIRAPMTSVFMIFEITQDYQILVPLMVANLLSYVISRHYQPAPVYHALLQQDGIHLPTPTTQTPRAARTARHVMTSDMSFLPPDLSVADAWQWALQHDAPVHLVGTRDHFVGTVTRRQLDEWRRTDTSNQRLAGVIGDRFVHAHPDHPIDVVLERLTESGGVLPIVSRAEIHRIEGVVTPDTILPSSRWRSPRHRSELEA
jgi:CIC family chloride channel protein